MRVECEAATFEPVGFGIRTDKEEDVAYGPFLLDARLVIALGNRGKPTRQIAVKLGEFGVRVHLDVWRSLDPIDEIARHAGADAGPAHQHVDLRRVLRQENSGLPGRIAAANQHHFCLVAHFRFERGSPVPNAAALELA